MWVMVLCFALSFLLLMILVNAFLRKRKRKRAKRKEETALKGIAAGISERLYAAYPDSKWRWVCRPANFTANGGIARIEILYSSGKQQFADVCLATSGYMALHLLNAVELSASDLTPPISVENSVPTATQQLGAKPNDEESVSKWYNIVLINSLTSLINDLNADGEVCLFIGQDGKAYVDENGRNAVVFDFGEMPDVTLWGHITEKLSEDGLFAEVQEDNCIFISWA